MIPVKVVTKSGALQETTIFGEKSPDYVIPLEQRGFFKESFTIHKFKSEEITSWTSTDPPPKEYGYECLQVYAKEIQAYTVYCDSVAWDENPETMDTRGNGTQENPYRNVNYALAQLECYSGINRACPRCEYYIRVVITGTVNYLIGKRDLDWPGLILDCAGAEFTYNRVLDGNSNAAKGVFNFYRCYIYNCNINISCKGVSASDFSVIYCPEGYVCNSSIEFIGERSETDSYLRVALFYANAYQCTMSVDTQYDNQEYNPWKICVFAQDSHSCRGEISIGSFKSSRWSPYETVFHSCELSVKGNALVHDFSGNSRLVLCNSIVSVNRDSNYSLASIARYTIYGSTLNIAHKNCTGIDEFGGDVYNSSINASIEADISSLNSRQGILFAGDAFSSAFSLAVILSQTTCQSGAQFWSFCAFSVSDIAIKCDAILEVNDNFWLESCQYPKRIVGCGLSGNSSAAVYDCTSSDSICIRNPYSLSYSPDDDFCERNNICII